MTNTQRSARIAVTVFSPSTPTVTLDSLESMTRKRTFSLPDDVSTQLDQVAGDNASAYVVKALRDRIARDAASSRIREAYGTIDPVAYQHWVERLTAVPTAEPTSRRLKSLRSEQ